MPETCTSCIKDVGPSGRFIRYGKTPQGKQRYKCLDSGRTFLIQYQNKAYESGTDHKITALLKEGCGCRSIARLLNISSTTVQSRILKIAAQIHKPALIIGKDYEVDELCTFIGNKASKRWIVYALRKEDRKVVDFRIGTRTNKTIKPVIQTLGISGAKTIYTDGLKNYKTLIDSGLHKVKRFGTNRIERLNLTLRTHLKRLTRRTICFSRSWKMLNACLKIYFWSIIGV